MLTCGALTPNFEYMGRKCSMLSNFYTVPKIKIISAKRNQAGIAGADATVYVWLLVAYNWRRNQTYTVHCSPIQKYSWVVNMQRFRLVLGQCVPSLKGTVSRDCRGLQMILMYRA